MSFKHFEQNPETAVLQYLLNSGLEKFRGLDDLGDLESGTIDYEGKLQAIVKEIKEEVPTRDQLHKLIEKYLTKQGRGSHSFPGIDHMVHKHDGFDVLTLDSYIMTCGACGYRDAEGASHSHM